MSTPTSSPVSHSTDVEYVTDWRAVGGIVGIVLVLIVAVTATQYVKLEPPRKIAVAGSTIDASQATQKVVEGSATNTSVPPETIPFVVIVPWISSGTSSSSLSTPVASQSRDTVDSIPTVETNQSLARSTQVVATVTPAVKEKLPPSVEMIEDELEADANKQSIEVSIDDVTGAREKLIPSQRRRDSESNSRERPSSEAYLFSLFETNAKLEGLPLRKGIDCQQSKETAAYAQTISKALRQTGPFSATNTVNSAGFDNDPDREIAFEMSCVNHLRNAAWRRPEAISTLVQMVQASSHLVRLELVTTLASIDGSEATLALVDRAIFDLSRSVRTAAIEALKSRELGDAEQQKLIRGLRYPWSPVADNAAAAIIALERTEMLPQLAEVAEQPDPRAPFIDADGKWRRTELVRVNHLRNCILCHVVSTSDKDPLRGLVPTPGRPAVGYNGSHEGDFIRADVTYLKQDFSLMKLEAKAHPWPTKQRFDYLLRSRQLTSREKEQAASAAKDRFPTYAQREAVLRAIRELSSGRKDVG